MSFNTIAVAFWDSRSAGRVRGAFLNQDQVWLFYFSFSGPFVPSRSLESNEHWWEKVLQERPCDPPKGGLRSRFLCRMFIFAHSPRFSQLRRIWPMLSGKWLCFCSCPVQDQELDPSNSGHSMIPWTARLLAHLPWLRFDTKLCHFWIEL